MNVSRMRGVLLLMLLVGIALVVQAHQPLFCQSGLEPCMQDLQIGQEISNQYYDYLLENLRHASRAYASCLSSRHASNIDVLALCADRARASVQELIARSPDDGDIQAKLQRGLSKMLSCLNAWQADVRGRGLPGGADTWNRYYEITS